MKPALSVLVVLLLVPLALAQQHTTSVQPQVPQKTTAGQAAADFNLSGRDPFQYNTFTGRFDYVPLPYEQSPNAPYSPFQYNPFSGQFDYVPAPAPAAPDYGPRIEKGGGNAANYIDTRVNTQVQQPSLQVNPIANEPVPAAGTIAPAYTPPPPTEVYRRRVPPSPNRAPATQPASTKPAGAPAT